MEGHPTTVVPSFNRNQQPVSRIAPLQMMERINIQEAHLRNLQAVRLKAWGAFHRHPHFFLE